MSNQETGEKTNKNQYIGSVKKKEKRNQTDTKQYYREKKCDNKNILNSVGIYLYLDFLYFSILFFMKLSFRNFQLLAKRYPYQQEIIKSEID